jgi:hypothetical protein
MQINYELNAINRTKNEWSVTVKGESLPRGTIRRLSHRTYGWNDSSGLHEYQSQHEAAIHCIRLSRTRQTRQIKRSENFRLSVLRSA